MMFSIITVHLNHPHGLKATQDSLMSQTCQDYEWIIIDGGSGPETQNLLQHSKASWTSEPDQGIYDAMNKGIERAKGTYLLFLNAGDILATPHILQDTMDSIGDAVDFIYGSSLESGHLKPARPYSRALLGMFTHHQSMFYNRKTLGTLRYDIHYKIAADYKLTLQHLAHSNRVLYLPFPVCVFEPGGISQKNARLGRREQFKIRDELKSCPPWQNIAIYLGQAALMALRQIFPKIYWFLKKLR